MPFYLYISDQDREYLDKLPLSLEAKDRINQFIERYIANISDDFRLNPENRHKPELPYFVVQYIILDLWGDRRFHSIDFHIRDDKAESGVLLIVFIDHH